MPGTGCACGCGLRVSRKGVFRKNHQPAGTSRDPEGKEKAANAISNPISNPIWNPISNGRVQERAREEAEERIAKMPKSEPMLTEAEAAAKAEQIMKSECTMGCTLGERLGVDGPMPTCMDYHDAERDHHDDSPFCDPESGEPCAPHDLSSVYVGYTGRSIKDEALRWLTVRGASPQGEDGTFVDPAARNRPTLLWADGSTITMTQAQTLVGFVFFEVYSSTLMINARYVEKALQKRYQHLPLGLRLWRHPDKGKKYDKEVDGKLHKVFIACSPRVAQMLAEREIKVNF